MADMGEPAVVPLPEVRVVPVRSIRPYPGNPRRISDKAVVQTAASIREFGWEQPIVVDPDFVVIVGHVRRLAAIRLKLDVAPVVVAEHLSAEQVRAYRVADNRTHDYAVWDYGLLARELDGLDGAFGEVLDLADWRKVIGGFEALPAGTLDLEDDAAGLFGVQHTVTVLFASAEDRDRAGPEIMKIAGVVDVRYPDR